MVTLIGIEIKGIIYHVMGSADIKLPRTGVINMETNKILLALMTLFHYVVVIITKLALNRIKAKN